MWCRDMKDEIHPPHVSDEEQTGISLCHSVELFLWREKLFMKNYCRIPLIKISLRMSTGKYLWYVSYFTTKQLCSSTVKTWAWIYECWLQMIFQWYTTKCKFDPRLLLHLSSGLKLLLIKTEVYTCLRIKRWISQKVLKMEILLNRRKWRTLSKIIGPVFWI